MIRGKRRHVAVVILAGLGLVGVAEWGKLAAQERADEWRVPDIDSLPDDSWGRTVRHGRDLIARTAELIGPEVADPSRRFAGNNLNCQSCHREAGTRKFGLPFVGVFADFPNYRGREGKVGTIEDRIQGCMTRSLNGRPLPPDGPEMTAMVAYLKFLSTGRPVGAATVGRGSMPVAELNRAADPVRGRKIYEDNCAICHGARGEGQRNGTRGDTLGYATPPLWGQDSFNDGAGMARLATAANFIRSNMPNGTDWAAPALSVEDTWDVAAFIISQPRPHKEGLEKDYPNLAEKPVDSPYGPYPDSFSPEQHRFGPFAPIRKARADNAARRLEAP